MAFRLGTCAIRLNDSRKDSIPFQSSPYVWTNIITGTRVPKRIVLGHRFVSVSILMGEFSP
jgi:hypothetical protein